MIMILEQDEDGVHPIDIDGLASSLEFNDPVLIDGHLSHLLPVEASAIIRCDPLSYLTAYRIEITLSENRIEC